MKLVIDYKNVWGSYKSKVKAFYNLKHRDAYLDKIEQGGCKVIGIRELK